jgi:putative transcriptional regulator
LGRSPAALSTNVFIKSWSKTHPVQACRINKTGLFVNWTQAQLADVLDVSRQTINAIETGKFNPSLPLAFRAARLFGLHIEDFS